MPRLPRFASFPSIEKPVLRSTGQGGEDDS